MKPSKGFGEDSFSQSSAHFDLAHQHLLEQYLEQSWEQIHLTQHAEGLSCRPGIAPKPVSPLHLSVPRLLFT